MNGLSVRLLRDSSSRLVAQHTSRFGYLIFDAGCAYILHPGLDYCHWTSDCSCNASGDAPRQKRLNWGKPTMPVSSPLRAKVVDSILDELKRQEMHPHANS